MHYRNGVENPRNITKVADDGRVTAFAVVFDAEDAVSVVAMLNAAAPLSGVESAAVASGAFVQALRNTPGHGVEAFTDAEATGSIHGGVRT